MLDKTSVVITADHGFSYYFSPVREKYVISSYRENYNVPFIIYNADVEIAEGDFGLSNVASTVAKLLGYEPDEHWNPSIIK